MKRVIKSANNQLRDSFLGKNKIRDFEPEQREIIFNNIQQFEYTMSAELSSRVKGLDVDIDCESTPSGKNIRCTVNILYNGEVFETQEWLLKLEWFLDLDTIYTKLKKSKYYKATIRLLDKSFRFAVVESKLNAVNIGEIFKRSHDLWCEVEGKYWFSARYADGRISIWVILRNFLYHEIPQIKFTPGNLSMGLIDTYGKDCDEFLDFAMNCDAQQLMESLPFNYDPNHALSELLNILEVLSSYILDMSEINVKPDVRGVYLEHDSYRSFAYWEDIDSNPDSVLSELLTAFDLE